MRSDKGLTLIEILIVLAVMAILVILILVGIRGAQIKARDNRIRSDVRQLRLLAEQVYDENGASYRNWRTRPHGLETQIEVLLNDIQLNYGLEAEDYARYPNNFETVIRDSQRKEFCISAPMRGDEDTYFCADATGVFKTVSEPCEEQSGPNPDPLRCAAN